MTHNAPGIAAGLFLLGSKSPVCSIKKIATNELSYKPFSSVAIFCVDLIITYPK